MSTRATILFKRDGESLVKLYHHWDGYISGLGHHIAEWLCQKRIGNGIGLDCDENFANGVGCLVAQFIRDFKDGVGNLYVESLDVSNEDYNYVIDISTDYDETRNCNDVTKIMVTNWDDDTPIFEGTPKELLNFNEDDEEED